MGRWNVGADFIDFPTLVKDNKRSAANNNNEVFIHTFPLSLLSAKGVESFV